MSLQNLCRLTITALSRLYFCKQNNQLLRWSIFRWAQDIMNTFTVKLFHLSFCRFFAKTNGRAYSFESYLLLHKPHIKLRDTKNIKCNWFIEFIYCKCQNQFYLEIWNPIWREHNLGSLCAPINITGGCKLQDYGSRNNSRHSVHAWVGLKSPSNMYGLYIVYVIWILYAICFSISHISSAII